MTDRLVVDAAHRWARTALGRLGAVRARIDRINVFPVADADTGTNLYLTLRAGVLAVRSPGGAGGYSGASGCRGAPGGHPGADGPSGDGTQEPGGQLAHSTDQHGNLAEIAERCARGALLGARGNSGIILSQLLAAWADVLRRHPGGEAAAVRAAWAAAADAAYAAVSSPREGTMVSVARAAAEAAAVESADDVARVVSAAARGARSALDQSPTQLAVLRDAGVVDAGGYGLVVLVDALRDTLCGTPTSWVPPRFGLGRAAGMPVGAGGTRTRNKTGTRNKNAGHAGASSDGPSDATADDDGTGEAGAGEAGVSDAGGRVVAPGPAFEVMHLLDAPDDRVPALRDRLGALGDSVVVAGGHELWNVHVHTDDIGGVLDAALEAGRPHRVRVMSLPSAMTAASPSVEADSCSERLDVAHPEHRSPPGLTVIAATCGPGIAALCASVGAVPLLSTASNDRVQSDGMGSDVSRHDPTDDVLQAILDAPSTVIVVLPDSALMMTSAHAAAVVARRAGIQVAVLDTRSTAQVLAGLAIVDDTTEPTQMVARLAAAAARTRYAAVPLPDRTGDGAVSDEVEGALVAAPRTVVSMLDAHSELVTVVIGADPAAARLAVAVRDAVRHARPDVDVQLVDGGQPAPALVLGIE
ncbi:MAG: DAK2 domain-containing protein [Angustibacter sp.]